MNQKQSTDLKPARPSLPWWLAPLLAVAITLVGGALHGRNSNRWGPPADRRAAAAHLATMPKQIGRWKLVEELPIDEASLTMLECDGYLYRRYTHQDTGQSINVVILVGPPGPIAVHTPEICFSSRAYEIQGQRKAVAMQGGGGAENSYWCTDFQSKNPFADALHVYYAWSPGGPWKASKSPRYEYAGSQLLYKIQLAVPMTREMMDSDSDPGRQFLEDLRKSGWRLLGD